MAHSFRNGLRASPLAAIGVAAAALFAGAAAAQTAPLDAPRAGDLPGGIDRSIPLFSLADGSIEILPEAPITEPSRRWRAIRDQGPAPLAAASTGPAAALETAETPALASSAVASADLEAPSALTRRPTLPFGADHSVPGDRPIVAALRTEAAAGSVE